MFSKDGFFISKWVEKTLIFDYRNLPGTPDVSLTFSDVSIKVRVLKKLNTEKVWNEWKGREGKGGSVKTIKLELNEATSMAKRFAKRIMFSDLVNKPFIKFLKTMSGDFDICVPIF